MRESAASFGAFMARPGSIAAAQEKERAKVVVGTKGDFASRSFVEDGKQTGFDEMHARQARFKTASPALARMRRSSQAPATLTSRRTIIFTRAVQFPELVSRSIDRSPRGMVVHHLLGNVMC